ncbi:hypothetical protein [Actinomycetospora chiangmaiensis]|uniref:hypothetical protein n=1 Tax=Actinomycetospora chiangmaiensis TaxID=402650 RepID=UPI000368A41B|nr:hypothetical protein [Actinomycetospora chiangmaiensis]
MLVASPTVELDVHRCDPGAVVVRMSGVPGHTDLVVLRRTLEHELDDGPVLVVVEVDRLASIPELREVLAATRDRARRAGGGLRVVSGGRNGDRAQEITELL